MESSSEYKSIRESMDWSRTSGVGHRGEVIFPEGRIEARKVPIA